MSKTLAWVAAFIIAAAYLIMFSPAFATWKPEYAALPQSVRDWYRNAELTPEAQKRFNFKSCCEKADVVKTQFRVSKSTSGDEWFWDRDGQWQRIPEDVIHWGETAPDGQATLFVVSGREVCFWPPDGGI